MSAKPAAKPNSDKSQPSEAAHDRNTNPGEHGLAERSVNEPHPEQASKDKR
ncbi:MAG TPA: hypothetical protein VGB81_01005 [Devosia sp.]|jgi:hypothetical protein